MQRPYKKERLLILSQDQIGEIASLKFKISNQTHTYNCVVNAFKTAGYSLVKSNNWNCLWTTLIKQSRLKSMNMYQKINHFVGAWSLGSKANLWRNVQR